MQTAARIVSLAGQEFANAWSRLVSLIAREGYAPWLAQPRFLSSGPLADGSVPQEHIMNASSDLAWEAGYCLIIRKGSRPA